jgi:vacuolar-type H+-ATPase catalytic subunit A/Vma1
VTYIAEAGDYNIDETVLTVDFNGVETNYAMAH